MKTVNICVILLSLVVLPSIVDAATVNVASCSQQDIQGGINAAASRDTILVPPGSCTWNTTVNIPSGKNIILKGAGIDVTTISSAGLGVMNIDLGSSRITGFTFNCSFIGVDGEGWRIDHNKMSCANMMDGVRATGWRANDSPKGLIDHVTFENMRVLSVGYPGVGSEILGTTHWNETLALGTDEAVYVEDSTFVFNQFGNAIDTNYAGRYVFRHNIVTDVYLEAHSVQGGHRATRKWEIYDNTIRQVNRSLWVPMFIRGGTGVIFNNTLTGAWTQGSIVFDNVRSFDNRTGWYPVDVTHPGACDGTSPWDGNQDASGYWCRDQIGRSTDQWVWTASNPYPPQELDPAYVWNNFYNGNPMNVIIHNCAGGYNNLGSCNHIKENRDYYLAQKPGYTPYTYPHPLQNAGGEIIPADRRIDWSSAGVEGGIPDRNIEIDCTKSPYNVHADGADTSGAIQACIDGIQKNQAAFLPAGTYTLSARLSLPSNKTLRGAGPDRTVLHYTTSLNGEIILNGGYTDYSNTYWYPSFGILSGYTKGSSQLMLDSIDTSASPDAGAFAPGRFVYISELNDPSIPVSIGGAGGDCTYCGLYGADGTRTRFQLSKVKGVNGNTITISPPMLFSLSAGLSPQVTLAPQGYVQFAGVEDLTIRNGGSTLTTNTGPGVWFQGAANSWVANVRIENCGTRCVFLWDDVYRNEVRGCHFSGVIDQVNSDRYAVEVWGGTGNLIEDNIFENTANGIVLVSSVGNVFAYNYMHGVHRTAGMQDWFWPDTWTHGAHSSYNLWEGNDETALAWDLVHGSSSHNMVFRNRFHGKDDTVSYDMINLQAVGAIITAPHNNYMTEIGNVLGTSGFQNMYETTEGAVGERAVWFTDRSYGGITTDEAFNTTLRHLNYDYFTNSAKHCADPGEPGCQGGDGSTVLPDSLYLTQKPSWFGDVPWPPIGPDVAGLSNKIPARLRFEALQGLLFHRSDTNQNNCVDISELLAFITRWKVSNTDVSLREIIEAIGLWKGGCHP